MDDRGSERPQISRHERIDEKQPGQVWRGLIEDLQPATDRQEREPFEEHELEDHAKPEHRHRDRANRQEPGDVVERATCFHTGQHPEWDADQDDEEHGRQDQLERRRHELAEVVEDRPAGRERNAEVAVDQAGDVRPVLSR